MREELHGILGQAGDVDQHFRRRVAVDQRIGDEERPFLASQDVQSTEMRIRRTDADDLLCHLGHFGIAAVNACHESIGVACLDHHHTECVAVDHLFASLCIRHAFAGFLLGQYLGVTMAAFRFAVVAKVDDLDTFEADVFFSRDLSQAFFVAQQDGDADTFGFCLGSGFQHVDMVGFCKDYPFRIGFCHVGERTEQLVVISHHFAQVVCISFPVGDRLTGYAGLDGSLGNGTGNTGEESRIERFRQDIIASESGAFQLVGSVYDVGNRFFGQFGNGIDGC